MSDNEHDEDGKVFCFDCGSSDVEKALQKQVFQYGSGTAAVDLTAEMPVYTCKACGYQFAGPEGDVARHEAVCRYLGVLTPAEIAKVRESTGLSRAEFCELTRIGIASLQRWETGSLIQNAANDELLFLMSFSENVNHLRERDRDSALKISLSKTGVDASCHRGSRRFRGRCLTDDKELQRCSEEWSLRVKAA